MPLVERQPAIRALVVATGVTLLGLAPDWPAEVVWIVPEGGLLAAARASTLTPGSEPLLALPLYGLLAAK